MNKYFYLNNYFQVEGTVTKFLIADPIWDGSEKEKANIAIEQAMLDEEQKLFKDLIFIRGIEDNYANLHLKVLEIIINLLFF